MARSIAPPGRSFWRNAAGSAAARPARRGSRKGYRLPARHVIHTVGPVWRGGERGEPELLASAYRSSLELARAAVAEDDRVSGDLDGRLRFPAGPRREIAVAP